MPKVTQEDSEADLWGHLPLSRASPRVELGVAPVETGGGDPRYVGEGKWPESLIVSHQGDLWGAQNQ